MVYVFTFLGEFGYELLNWQGVVRKFAATIPATDRIVCCSRANVFPLYESASAYLDISQVKSFQRSVACGYFALHPKDARLTSWRNRLFDHRLKRELVSFIRLQLAKEIGSSLHQPIFVFSSDKTELNGCTFGCERARYGVDLAEGNIYEQLQLDNNVFQKVEPDFSVRGSIERELGWSLSEPFILCQTRNREIVRRSNVEVPSGQLLEALSRRIKVVLLDFQTGRWLDSYSSFPDSLPCVRYQCPSFVHQTCIVHYAKHCLFVTEGDFGSHIYVPPFLGRDVTVIAPQTVYELGTTPIAFWNAHVFRFGGRIIPKVSEAVFETRGKMLEVTDEVLANGVSRDP